MKLWSVASQTDLTFNLVSIVIELLAAQHAVHVSCTNNSSGRNAHLDRSAGDGGDLLLSPVSSYPQLLPSSDSSCVSS